MKDGIMQQRELVVKQIPIMDIREHPRNPRRGSVSLIKESITENGIYKPLIVTSDNVILAGNHSYQALVRLGYDHAQVVQLDLHSDDPAATKIMLADNRTSDVSAHTYDDTELLALLEGLTDLTGTGYSDTDLHELVDLLGDLEGTTADGQAVVDDFADSYGPAPDGNKLATLKLQVESATVNRWRIEVARHADEDTLLNLLLDSLPAEGKAGDE